MNGEPLRRKVVITNPMGFHLRPIAAFAKLASRFDSSISVWKGDRRVNGKSPLELLTVASEKGTELILEAHGPDAAAALDALTELLTAPASEDETDPPSPRPGP